MKIKDLAHNPENPRKISDEKLQMLKKSLAKFGDLSGIIYNTKTKRLVGAHQRTKIFDPETPITITNRFSKPTKTGTVAEGYVEIGKDRFSYRETYWDEATEKAANIAANKGAGEWDDGKLTAWLGELNDLDFDMDFTMFDSKELAKFDIETGDKSRTGPGGTDEDHVPEKSPAITKPGDTYKLGDHRLMCGDSTKETDIARLIKEHKADMVFTDPPYGMNLDTDYSKIKGSKNTQAAPGTVAKKYRPIIGDDQFFDPSLVLNFFKEVQEIFLWGGDYYCTNLPLGTFIVWDKNNGNESADRMIGNAYEMCWSKSKHKKIMARIFGRGTFGHDKVKIHPTQKPVQLVEWFFEQWGNGCQNIIDLFGGSGSTLIACEKTNRKCFMMEIDPHYCDVIIDRWEKYTGRKAELLPKPVLKKGGK